MSSRRRLWRAFFRRGETTTSAGPYGDTIALSTELAFVFPRAPRASFATSLDPTEIRPLPWLSANRVFISTLKTVSTSVYFRWVSTLGVVTVIPGLLLVSPEAPTPTSETPDPIGAPGNASRGA
jgi:hypothetical protein